MACDQKKARREGRTIVLIDESGFMLQPLVRRTWAPRGQTPVHRSWDRHDRLSVVSALTVSPKLRRIGLYFELLSGNAHADEAERFVKRLRRKLGRNLLLVWDRLNVHRSAATRFDPDAIAVEWLPPYAPDLNPVEGVWNHTKNNRLANFLPTDLFALTCAVAVTITELRVEQDLLLSLFQHAGLFL